MTNRRGYLLIEMLTAITAGAVMLGISVGILGLLLRVERAGRDHGYRAMVLGRLAEQFRNDLHAALRQAPGEAGPKDQWRFEMGPDHAVTYRATADTLERDETAAGKPVRRESYALPPGCAARVDVSADRAPPLASLTVAPAGTRCAGSREVRIDAVLGRDHRFAKPEGGGR
jgi:hypothetical protein